MTKIDFDSLQENGRIYIDKPAGITSFGVVSRIRRKLTQHFGKKVKVGHCGTLDPFATGLLILLYGKETKNAMSMTKLDKVYEAEFILGFSSSTGDPEGELTPFPMSQKPSEKDLLEAAKKLTGKIQQTPPAFSAIKINGKRAYDLARAGKEVEIPSRIVEIFSFDILEYDFPSVKIRAHVSSGTYIRTLAEDFGELLGTKAYCKNLRRTKIADISIENSNTLEDFDIHD